MTYEKYKLRNLKGTPDAVHPWINGAFDIKIAIPLNAPGNIDYEAYKEWVDAGNTPEAAD